MKKIFFSAILMLASLNMASAQSAENAIGIRFGGGSFSGGEISYQRWLNDNNRLELDLGFSNDDALDVFQLTGLYQWVNPLDGSFYWYLGAGGGLASINIDRPDGDDDSELYLLAAGQAGLEYRFDFPLQISLDARPEFRFFDDIDDLGIFVGLGVRYMF